ncbi:acyltransferase [Longispora fulva]|uniref:Peptidoglycan/LPS O-acetylase OafA/YrhL n=1 Tax=Longispora fulva TaxID=619741 RepID=A0A8J7KPJ1_9ACTN|nr:acyltransferase [Longispora fulva]MBG6141381.1 peptidoglycan/LPS O-acetylase OafA/YrhL [Longispora fulva]GIG59469.1 acyltransferase [Longispora fulva]
MHTLTHREYLAMRRFPALDGLRAVAALMVVFFHFGGTRWGFLSGWSGVHVFFVLSGFLITTLLLREQDRAGKISLRNFYLRRFFRIIPVYVITFAAVVAVFSLRGEYDASGLHAAMPYYLTFFNEFADPSAFIVSWSLGIEQKFYLFWPLLAFAVALGFRARLAVTVGTTALVLCLFPLVDGGWPVHYLVMLTGALLAVVLHHRRGFALLRPLTHPVAGTLVAVALVAGQVSIRFAVPWVGTEPPVIAAYGVLIALGLPALLGAGPVPWLLAQRPLAAIGDRSYALYLLQPLAGLMAGGVLAAPGTTRNALLVAAIALGMADLMYRVVEQPMIRLGRRLTAPPKPATTPPASPVEQDALTHAS